MQENATVKLLTEDKCSGITNYYQDVPSNTYFISIAIDNTLGIPGEVPATEVRD